MTGYKETQTNPPQPEQNTGQGAWFFGIVSGFAAILIISYGISFLTGEGATREQIGFGCVSIAYGVLALIALGCAVRAKTRSCILVTQVGGVFYLLIYVLALSTGLDTGFGLFGILLIALLLWCIWFSVNKMVRS